MSQSDYSFSQQLELSCPHCSQIFRVIIWLIIDIEKRPDLEKSIAEGMIHTALCPNCRQLVNIDTPLLIFCPNKPYPLVFSPSQQTVPEQEKQYISVLLSKLRENLGSDWQNNWLEEVVMVPIEWLPTTLNEGPEKAVLLVEEQVNRVAR